MNTVKITTLSNGTIVNLNHENFSHIETIEDVAELNMFANQDEDTEARLNGELFDAFENNALQRQDGEFKNEEVPVITGPGKTMLPEEFSEVDKKDPSEK